MTATAISKKHFYRCMDCLSIAVTDQKFKEATCGACGGHIAYLGETQVDHLVRKELRCPCDARCTGAVGPHCSCQCGGENHGSGLMIDVVVEAGSIPRFEIDPAARIKGEVFRALKASVWDAYKAKYGEVNERKYAGEWIANWQFYMDGQYIAKRIREAGAGASVARNKKLTALLGELAAR